MGGVVKIVVVCVAVAVVAWAVQAHYGSGRASGPGAAIRYGAQERRTPVQAVSPVRAASRPSEWRDRYLLQMRASSGEWRRAAGPAHPHVEAAWDAAVRLCEAGIAAQPSLRAVRIIDNVAGLERVVDCRTVAHR